MIIGSWDWQPIGSIQHAYWHPVGTPPGELHPYMVIREATYEEWLAEASANARDQGRPFDMNHPRCTYYFEISVD